MVVYIDTYFFINFFADYLSLIGTAIILRRKLFCVKILASSLIGATFSVLTVIFNTNSITAGIISLLGLSISVLIAFGYFSIRDYISNISLVVVLSMFIGGITESINFLTVEIAGESLLLKIFLFVFFSFFAILAMRKILNTSLKTHRCTAEIFLNGSIYELDALIDSGSFLRDPLSQRPIILIPQSVYQREFNVRESVDFIYSVPLKCRGIGGSAEITPLYCEKIIICYNNRKFTSNAIPAIVSDSAESFSGFKAIIPESALGIYE